jgi:hypothetical protein
LIRARSSIKVCDGGIQVSEFITTYNYEGEQTDVCVLCLCNPPFLRIDHIFTKPGVDSVFSESRFVCLNCLRIKSNIDYGFYNLN